MSDKFGSGIGYSSLNTARSALSLISSSIDGHQIGSHAIVSRMIKGIGKLRPPARKYNSTWNPDIVLNYLKTLWPLESLIMKQLVYKCVTLLALISAQRVQTLSLIRLSEIQLCEAKIEIFISEAIKTSKPGALQPKICIPVFKDSPELCLFTTMKYYIEKTKFLRAGIDNLFLSLSSPSKAVGSQTISRWIKHTMADSGIDVQKFKAHSCRHSATSAAYKRGVSIDQIKRTAVWTENSKTFFMFYTKPSSYILIYRDTVVPLSFGGTWWHPGCKLCRKPG